MIDHWLMKRLGALLWALLACFGEVAAQDNPSQQVRLFYAQDSQELRNFTDGLNHAGITQITHISKIRDIECDLPGKIITFGGDASEVLIRTCPEKPIIFVASNFYYEKLKDYLAKGSWGYFNEQPLAKQLEHADRNIPSIKTLGVLYNDNDGDLSQIMALAKSPSRIQVKLVKVEDGQIIAQALRSLYEKVDAVLVTSNQDIWPLQDFKTYLLLGMRQGKIMIGGHNQFYTNRGVISSVNNDFEALGAQMAKELNEKNHPQVRYFRNSLIVTNQMLAARYGIYIGDKPGN